MMHPHAAGRWLAGLVGVIALVLAAGRAPAQAPAPPEAKATGQFFSIVEPITDEQVKTLESATGAYLKREAAQGRRPLLFFEFRAGQEQPGRSSYGNAADLADLISKKLGGAHRTVAFVPEPLAGFAVLGVLACDEIIMAPGATLGPILPAGETVTERERAEVRTLAARKGRAPELWLGMLDPNLDLLEVKTVQDGVHFVLAADLDAFKQKHALIENPGAAWEGGQRGILSAERARLRNVANLLLEDRGAIREAYRLAGGTADYVLNRRTPVIIRIEGPIDAVKESYLKRKIADTQSRGVNLIFFEFNCPGGTTDASDKVADLIVNLQGVRTVAFLDDRALGMASLVALACDDIVFRRDGGRLGDGTQIVTGDGQIEGLDASLVQPAADRAAALARKKGHPEAVARALFDADVTVLRASDPARGWVGFVTEDQVQKEPNRFQVRGTVHPKGEVLTIDDREAADFEMESRPPVGSLKELVADYDLNDADIRVDGPTWVDALVTTLNTPWMSWLLLFIGLFMLILELKLPGIGLPAIASALAFLLFFWGHYLGGTADRLEIMLFLVGLVCLALELFVFPGYGVFGVSGILLILISVIMASHTFVWPTQEYEYRQMGNTLLQVTVAIIAVSGGAIALGRYFPSLPLFNRMVLVPEPAGGGSDLPEGKPIDPETSLFFLVGETGRTTTVLRPTGKARFGELLVDVTADGFYIEADQLVEVVEVHGARVIVKRA